jgi:hypothetical protein
MSAINLLHIRCPMLAHYPQCLQVIQVGWGRLWDLMGGMEEDRGELGGMEEARGELGGMEESRGELGGL